MKISKTIASALAVAFVLFACGKDDDDEDENKEDPYVSVQGASTPGTGSGGTISLHLTQEAIGSLPVSKEAASSLWLATPEAAAGDPNSSITSFFAFECHWGNDTQTDFCPSAIKTELGGSYDTGVANSYKKYKLSTTTLIGSIAHADMYILGPYKYSDSASLNLADDGSQVDIVGDAFSFKTDDAGGDADKYVIGIPGFYNALSTSGDETAIYHKSGETTVTKFGTFVPRKASLSGGTESAFFQTYATTNAAGTAGNILAYNYAGLNDYATEADFAQRVVLIVNMATRKFAIKQGSGGTRTIVTLGQGGIDKTTGEYLEGSYYARFVEGSTEWEACIDNQTQKTVEHTANCTETYKFFDGNASTTLDIADFLGLSASEKADLVNFLAFFETDAALTADQMPANADDSLKHFPNRVIAN